MFSNIFLIAPVLFAAAYHEWFYLFFATGLLIFSPFYHWYKITKPHTHWYRIFRDLDIAFAVGGFMYMYYFVNMYSPDEYTLLLFSLLSVIIVFWWYAHAGDYKKFHPWFHIAGPAVSSLILLLTR